MKFYFSGQIVVRLIISILFKQIDSTLNLEERVYLERYLLVSLCNCILASKQVSGTESVKLILSSIVTDVEVQMTLFEIVWRGLQHLSSIELNSGIISSMSWLEVLGFDSSELQRISRIPPSQFELNSHALLGEILPLSSNVTRWPGPSLASFRTLQSLQLLSRHRLQWLCISPLSVSGMASTKDARQSEYAESVLSRAEMFEVPLSCVESISLDEETFSISLEFNCDQRDPSAPQAWEGRWSADLKDDILTWTENEHGANARVSLILQNPFAKHMFESTLQPFMNQIRLHKLQDQRGTHNHHTNNALQNDKTKLNEDDEDDGFTTVRVPAAALSTSRHGLLVHQIGSETQNNKIPVAADSSPSPADPTFDEFATPHALLSVTEQVTGDFDDFMTPLIIATPFGTGSTSLQTPNGLRSALRTPGRRAANTPTQPKSVHFVTESRTCDFREPSAFSLRVLETGDSGREWRSTRSSTVSDCTSPVASPHVMSPSHLHSQHPTAGILHTVQSPLSSPILPSPLSLVVAGTTPVSRLQLKAVSPVSSLSSYLSSASTPPTSPCIDDSLCRPHARLTSQSHSESSLTFSPSANSHCMISGSKPPSPTNSRSSTSSAAAIDNRKDNVDLKTKAESVVTDILPYDPHSVRVGEKILLSEESFYHEEEEEETGSQLEQENDKRMTLSLVDAILEVGCNTDQEEDSTKSFQNNRENESRIILKAHASNIEDINTKESRQLIRLNMESLFLSNLHQNLNPNNVAAQVEKCQDFYIFSEECDIHRVNLEIEDKQDESYSCNKLAVWCKDYNESISVDEDEAKEIRQDHALVPFTLQSHPYLTHSNLNDSSSLMHPNHVSAMHSLLAIEDASPLLRVLLCPTSSFPIRRRHLTHKLRPAVKVASSGRFALPLSLQSSRVPDSANHASKEQVNTIAELFDNNSDWKHTNAFPFSPPTVHANRLFALCSSPTQGKASLATPAYKTFSKTPSTCAPVSTSPSPANLVKDRSRRLVSLQAYDEAQEKKTLIIQPKKRDYATFLMHSPSPAGISKRQRAVDTSLATPYPLETRRSNSLSSKSQSVSRVSPSVHECPHRPHSPAPPPSLHASLPHAPKPSATPTRLIGSHLMSQEALPVVLRRSLQYLAPPKTQKKSHNIALQRPMPGYRLLRTPRVSLQLAQNDSMTLAVNINKTPVIIPALHLVAKVVLSRRNKYISDLKNKIQLISTAPSIQANSPPRHEGSSVQRLSMNAAPSSINVCEGKMKCVNQKIETIFTDLQYAIDKRRKDLESLQLERKKNYIAFGLLHRLQVEIEPVLNQMLISLEQHNLSTVLSLQNVITALKKTILSQCLLLDKPLLLRETARIEAEQEKKDKQDFFMVVEKSISVLQGQLFELDKSASDAAHQTNNLLTHLSSLNDENSKLGL